MGIIMRLAAVMLAAACCAATAAAKQPKAIDIWLRASIEVDRNGHVVKLDWEQQSEAHDLVAKRLVPVVQGWEFVPATADGKPVATRTGLLVHVVAEPHDDGTVQLRLVDAQTGPMATSLLVPPAYPMEAARRDVSASLMVTVEVAADGSPVIRGMTYESNSTRYGERYRKAFIDATTKAVSHWKFLPEVVAGHAVREPVMVPVAYCLAASEWCERARKRNTARETARESPAGVHMAESSAVALKTEISEQVI